MRSLVRILTALLLSAMVVPGAVAELYRCTRVIDGDTIGVMRDGREVRVRLEGVDAPETRQDFSQRAKQFTSTATFGKTVDVLVR